MTGSNLFAKEPLSGAAVALTTDNGFTTANGQPAMFAHCTGVPPTTANIFQHGCIMNRLDSGTGVNALYQNTGSLAVPVWTLLDTSLGGPATSVVDSNGNSVLLAGATASAVNQFTMTNSAAGAVSANAVVLSATGTDSAVSLSIVPKGATGILTLGLSTGTGNIVLGSSSGTQSVLIGNGAGIATVSIANTGVAGNTVNIAGAAVSAASDTVNIATGNAVTSGGKVVHIADGVPGAGTTNVITIGSGGTTTGTVAVTIGSVGAAAHTTLIQGGNGTGAITLTPAAAGTIVIGNTAQSGAITLGSSSTTSTVNINTGAGASTVVIANGTGGNTVQIANGVTTSALTDTVSIATGNAASTGIKVVNILTGTPVTSGNNRFTVGAGVTTLATINAAFTTYQSANYIASETGSNNAIAGALTDASGNNVSLAAGLRVTVKLAHTLQAGANTFVFNTVSKSITSHRNTGSNIGSAYTSGIIDLMYDGTQWEDMSQ